MITVNERIAELLRFTDETYFSQTDEQLLDLQDALSEIVESEETGEAEAFRPRVVLGAPRQVDLQAKSTVPLLLGRFQTGLRAWQVNPDPNTYLFVRNNTTGELIFSRPLIDMRRGRQPRPSGVGKPPDELNASSTSSGVDAVDLLDKMAGRLSLGRNSVTAVVYDVCSNTLDIQLGGKTQTEPSLPVKSDFVRHELDSSATVDTVITVPATGSASRGIEIRVATQMATEQGLVRAEEGRLYLSWHLILVRLDAPPVIVSAFVPVQEIRNPEGETAYNARFVAELGTQGPQVPPGNYQVYSDLGGGFRGPFPLAVTE
ncbi:MAG: hypothetical protein JMN24_18535 [gamma proteobacterium endosymbiont of Lamellibrachia anaximandri]|nr:hypothetical protein [gamma proteobacterium endosymbiont of Lamellibrachia anaximandri]MBL3617722.1 hypothetical protein [gamma proteobacterium endosymbiont of Lamellibrachia anaximandri]